MRKLWIRFWRRFGFYPEPLTMAGIYGVTGDGCYIVLGTDGVLRKSPPVDGLSDEWRRLMLGDSATDSASAVHNAADNKEG